VQELPDLLRQGDVLVVNDTKVFPARLHGRQPRPRKGEGAKIEIMLHKRIRPLRSAPSCARRSGSTGTGDRVFLGMTLEGTVVSRDAAEVEILFDKQGRGALDHAIAAEGRHATAYPYIAGRRKPDARDIVDYQTIYGHRTRFGRGAHGRPAFHAGALSQARG